MTNDEKDSVHAKFHREGEAFVLDTPRDPKETATETRHNEAHEFQRDLVKSNRRVAWFNGLLVFATFCTIGVGVWQGTSSQTAATAAKDAATAAAKSNYLACLTAQATQATLLQIQRSASDSHASTIATIEQARAGIVSNRAVILFEPRVPLPRQLFNNKLAILFSLKNTGKSDALNLTLTAKAILRNPADHIDFKSPNLVYSNTRFPSGEEFPEKPADDRPHPITALVPVTIDGQGDVVASSKEAISFLTGEGSFVQVFGLISYADLFGTHKVRFCYPMSVLKSRAIHIESPSEKNCVRYSKEEDKYEEIPNTELLPPIQASPIQPVSCTKPPQ